MLRVVSFALRRSIIKRSSNLSTAAPSGNKDWVNLSDSPFFKRYMEQLRVDVTGILPYRQTLKNGQEMIMERIRTPFEAAQVRQLVNAVIAEGRWLPWPEQLDEAEFYEIWMGQHHDTYVMKLAESGKIIGSCYLKPNSHGSHIANGGIVVDKAYRAFSVGTLTGSLAPPLAKRLGFKAIVYNQVLANNAASIAIWKGFGYQHIGTLPNALKGKQGYIDGLIFYKALES